jgi:hypothetical protein
MPIFVYPFVQEIVEPLCYFTYVSFPFSQIAIFKIYSILNINGINSRNKNLVFLKCKGARNTIPGIKKDHSVNPEKQSINKAICCFIPKIRQGFILLIEQNKHPELRWLPIVRSK